jgi:lysozyme
MATKRPAPKGVAALIVAACAIAAPVVMSFEGKRNATYLDPIKIPTACFGHTGSDVRMGQLRTDAECAALLNADLRKHAEGVIQCTPTIQGPVLAAATSLAFNIGVNAYCASTAARRFNSGDLRGGCEALGRFQSAGGRKLPGLVRRRAAEIQLCMTGVGK